MADEDVTREVIFNVPLRAVKGSSKARRADSAISYIKEFVSHHLKVNEDRIWMDPKVSEIIWKRGRTKPPSKISVKVIMLEEGTTEIIVP